MNSQNRHSAGFIKGALAAVKSGLIEGERFLKRIGVENLTDDQLSELIPYLELDSPHMIQMLKSKRRQKKRPMTTP